MLNETWHGRNACSWIFSLQLDLEYGPLSPEDKSWTALKSRGALVKAAPHIEDQVYKINAAFNQYHKHGKLVTGKKIHKRTCDFIMRQDECKTVNKALVELLIKGSSSKYLTTEYESKLILNLRLVFTVGSIKMQHF